MVSFFFIFLDLYAYMYIYFGIIFDKIESNIFSLYTYIYTSTYVLCVYNFIFPLKYIKFGGANYNIKFFFSILIHKLMYSCICKANNENIN